ncbi:hypothetical protein EDD22DRAFT_239831 [Suillus occidentalis]|nr:hypothetical protein EDD22DRAFT_239831 [Suillus occidentalis]
MGFKAKAYFVEPLLTAIIQNRLADTLAVDNGIALLQCSPLKPVVVNRALQNILQHPQPRMSFHSCAYMAGPSLPQIETLYYPSSPSGHPSPGTSASSQLDAVQNMDHIRMLRTCHIFPIWRRMSDKQEGEKISRDEQVYEPSFVTLLVCSNVCCLPAVCLQKMKRLVKPRSACWQGCGNLWKFLSDTQEKQHALYIFTFLKNLIKPSSDGPPSRLPSYVTLILPHALRGILSFKFCLLTCSTFLSSALRVRSCT